MTTNEFNTKYEAYLETGHYGLDIDDENIINYLDGVFQDLIKIPGFKYSQIKLKFNMGRFYTNLHEVFPKFSYISNRVEDYITDYFKYYDLIKKIKS